MKIGTFVWVVMLAAAPAAFGADLPAPAGRAVDFEKDVRPILQERCLSCHARGKTKGGLSLETRAALLQGGEGGPAVVVGKSGESLLVQLVAGVEEDRRMPQKGAPLSDEQIGVLRAWIDQGAAWPEGLSFGFRRAPLAPRTPQVPPAPAGRSWPNPIDRFLARELGEAAIAAPIVPDRVFVRRVYLDLVGLLPTAEQRDGFLADTGPDKRERLVNDLLADRRAYADHWLSFWNDALRNAYRGTGFIDGGRSTITGWLYRALYENAPYDRFVRELVSPVPGAEGFTKGIVWRGVVNASQAPPVQAAQNVAQVFLGTNLKCASCHDSFVNYWKLTDAYALASVFADKPLEIHRCDKPTGKTSSIGFIYPELGDVADDAPRAERMKQLADLLVKPENGRFARTIVNRLWAHLMGRGLVEPLDDMDQVPWSQDLLDWLAADFVAHGHDLKHTLGLIASSRAYQLPSMGVPSPGETEPYRFRGPLVRRMSAEQFADALSAVTGVWPRAAGELLAVDGRGQGGQVAAARAAVAAATRPAAAPPRVEAQWIWSHPAAVRDPGGRILVRKVIHVDKVPTRAVAVAACDNEFVLYVNGRKAAEGAEWNRPTAADVTRLLKPGDNVVAIEATNWPDPAHNKGTHVTGANPAALIAWVGAVENGRPTWGVGTDASWLCAKEAAGDWMRQPYDTAGAGWAHAAELPAAPALYGRVDLAAALGRPGADDAPVRAALEFDDPLLAALGRTSREQVVTRRDSVATTLQALELLHGSTLDARLRQGAQARIEAHRGAAPEDLIRGLFRDALGRDPLPAELAASRELVGDSATVEGVQDLLWAVVMLPEFQLID